ncbi:hypothetical protein [Chromobacterium paludis]|uniref:Uncharacterized protein n=1 Tax=Chromobacterium paludis TaxID=2605945 RepID=A0A5C1DLR4_9NEIS|nr:hypothetical protein [Chromobacterium paludis]QEL56738.1 hypothetical protein FYK34_14800 [Chromobacterium paludis]
MKADRLFLAVGWAYMSAWALGGALFFGLREGFQLALMLYGALASVTIGGVSVLLLTGLVWVFTWP